MVQAADINWVTDEGEEVVVTRAYFHENAKQGSWCPSEKQRASEYDAVYEYIRDYAVELTSLERKPHTAVEAARHLAAKDKIGGKQTKGNMSIPRFMEMCVKERKQKREASAAAHAAAKAAS